MSIETPVQGTTIPSKIVTISAGGNVTGGVMQWTNMPLALTELGGVANRRVTLDLRPHTQWRLMVNNDNAGAGTPVIGVQYSLDSGSNWAGLDNGTDATISDTTVALAVSSNVSSFASINTAARVADAMIRIVGSGGDGAGDPTFSLIAIEFR